jgi:DeoR family fructose operon transcriptional repressor
MDSESRQTQILGMARNQGRVEVAELVSELGVAAETIRRDLRALVDRGVLRRVHGGAIAVETAGYESSVQYRTYAHAGQKRRIAAAAAQLMHGAETVYIDEGSTPRLVAGELTREGQQLTVITSSLLAADILADRPEVRTLLIGGRLRGRTKATVDDWALRMLSEFVIDLAFIGANGISRELGLTTPDPAVAAVKREAIRRSRRRVLVGVHAKFGVSSFSRFAELADFETAVTGTELSATEARRYEAMGPRVIRA